MTQLLPEIEFYFDMKTIESIKHSLFTGVIIDNF